MFEEFELKTERSLVARDLFDTLRGISDKNGKNLLFEDDRFRYLDIKDVLMYWATIATELYNKNYHEACYYEFAKTFVDLLIVAIDVPNEFLNYDNYFDFFDDYYDGDLIVQAAFWFHVEMPDIADECDNNFFEFWNDNKDEIIEEANGVLTFDEMSDDWVKKGSFDLMNDF